MAARPHQEVLDRVQAFADAAAPARVSPRDEPGGVPLVSAATLRLELAAVDAGASMEDDLIRALQDEIEGFLEASVTAGCQVCLRRGGRAGVLRTSDIGIYLRRHTGISVGLHLPQSARWRRPKRSRTDG